MLANPTGMIPGLHVIQIVAFFWLAKAYWNLLKFSSQHIAQQGFRQRTPSLWGAYFTLKVK